MPYEIRQRGDSYYVIDTGNNDKIKGSYDSEDKAEDRKDELDFRAHVRSRIDRLPVSEMTADEKAAAYDKMMADKNTAPPPDPNLPPKKDNSDATGKPNKARKSAYWGELPE
jgi:hypothetical protein